MISRPVLPFLYRSNQCDPTNTHTHKTCRDKPAFHDTDTDILADIIARIVARMSACRARVGVGVVECGHRILHQCRRCGLNMIGNIVNCRTGRLPPTFVSCSVVFRRTAGIKSRPVLMIRLTTGKQHYVPPYRRGHNAAIPPSVCLSVRPSHADRLPSAWSEHIISGAI